MVSTTVMGCWWADHILTTFTLIFVVTRRVDSISTTPETRASRRFSSSAGTTCHPTQLT